MEYQGNEHIRSNEAYLYLYFQEAVSVDEVNYLTLQMLYLHYEASAIHRSSRSLKR